MNKKVVLAYSGGLDTSVAIKWLIDSGFDVVCYMSDVGQVGDFKKAQKKALKIGASKVYIDDCRTDFVKNYIFPALKANAVYEGKYFLATALSRPLIGKRLAEIAKKEKADCVAHGCTGKGNDQVRIELAVKTLHGNIDIIAPVREWDLPTRESEIEYAKIHNIPIDVSIKKPYSIDKNLWGCSIESGKLEDPSYEPGKDVYQMTKDPDKAPSKPLYINIYFEKGIPKKINGKKVKEVSLVDYLNKKGGLYSIGRSDIVEDRLVGIKSREIYEAPAAKILTEAHKSLEELVLDRETLHFKEMISIKYSRLIYDGLWFTPLRNALAKFIDETQKHVTGTVRMKLTRSQAVCVGRKSKYSKYKLDLATYGEGDTFDQSLAKGFIEIWGLPYKK